MRVIRQIALLVVPLLVLLNLHLTDAQVFDINELETQCESQIYCYGPLLDTVQMAGIFKDSKTFVDMKLKQDADTTIDIFNEMMNMTKNAPTKEDIENFVMNNFESVGHEFETWVPTDWVVSPKFLESIDDADFRQWGSDLNALWKELGRKMTQDVGDNPDLYSIIHVEHPVIVPGGRFREFYYWDSYWIIRGLLLSEMTVTAKGMLKNFLSIIERFGFIPNGGRIYYSKRSQPPLLAGMIKSYVEVTGDKQFGIDAVKMLESEFQFWMNNHTVEVNNHVLALYGDKSSGPRPESYSEDMATATTFDTDEEKEEHYSELKAGAESGMDFSSRWFINNGTNKGDLTHLKTRYIVPVELNAILFWNAQIIADFYLEANDTVKSAEYAQRAQELYDAVQAVLWDEEVGSWLDYDLINKKRRNYFSPTNLSPLWMKCYNESETEHISEKVLAYIKQLGLDDYPGGVPNTLEHTGEQWDFPNVWPPMQYILIEGLDNLGTTDAQTMAYSWAERWVRSNFIAYKETRAMYEKYSAETLGGHGGGGEYEIQLGFGWTNGVIMDLLNKYGSRLSTKGSTTSLKGWAFSGLVTSMYALIVTMTGHVYG